MPKPRAGLQKKVQETKTWSQRLGEALIAVVVAFAMLWVLPKLVPSSDSMTHLTAKAQAGLVGGYYPGVRRNEVTVVLIDDLALSRLGQGWPVPYATHARWLKNLARYQPKAIFLDVTFGQARQDDTLPTLVSALCALRDRNIPVFLAALQDEHTGQLAVRPGLRSPDGEEPCFTLVSVVYDKHKVDRLVWSYPLWAPIAGGAGAVAGQPTQALSAALAMAERVAGIPVVQRDDPMALTWEVNNLDQQRFAGWCRQARGGFTEIIPPFVRMLWHGEDVFKPVCPYSRALALSSLRSPSESEDLELQDLLGNRFVMVGANLQGDNDMVTSPVHGDIPGVFMHAMALDNLLTYEGRYKRALEWGLPLAWPLFWLGLCTVLAAHILRQGAIWLTAHLRSRLPRKKQRSWDAWAAFIAALPGSTDPAAPVSRLQRLRQRHWPWRRFALRNLLFLLFFLALKALSIACTTGVIMLLVVAAQGVFDIGTLPIVDLVVMALVAQWLGWTA